MCGAPSPWRFQPFRHIFCTLPHPLFQDVQKFHSVVRICAQSHPASQFHRNLVNQFRLKLLLLIHWIEKLIFIFCLMTRQTKKKDEKNHRLINQWILFYRFLPQEFHIVLVPCLKLAQSPQQHCLSAYIFTNYCFNNR